MVFWNHAKINLPQVPVQTFLQQRMKHNVKGGAVLSLQMIIINNMRLLCRLKWMKGFSSFLRCFRVIGCKTTFLFVFLNTWHFKRIRRGKKGEKHHLYMKTNMPSEGGENRDRIGVHYVYPNTSTWFNMPTCRLTRKKKDNYNFQPYLNSSNASSLIFGTLFL